MSRTCALLAALVIANGADAASSEKRVHVTLLGSTGNLVRASYAQRLKACATFFRKIYCAFPRRYGIDSSLCIQYGVL